ncbi:hypothetical protein B0T22DRAFT_458001 [Podospora appendiculata]|uniref:Hypervirulence associated protein TUDOR domain-containing protein n=1 Tax=Podospora appendiculata TaxID=314037 RepID=A0AAE0X8T5_9PEZI|nr:hypothetical protein B0T22DRAFT_458001 [Podospora appendiculata]
MAEQSEPEVGDKVSWNWGNGHPAGTVAEVAHEGDLSIKTQRGNTVTKNADPDNPAVRVERSANDVVKRASELTVDQKGAGGPGDEGDGDKPKSKEDDDDKKDEGAEQTADAKDTDAGTANEKETSNQENASAKKNEETDPHTITRSGKEVKRDTKQLTDMKGDSEQNGIVLSDDDDDDKADEDEYEPEEPVSEEDGEEERAAATDAAAGAAEDSRKRKAPESEPEQLQDEKKPRVQS